MRQPNSMKRNQNRLHSMMVVTTFQFILWCSTYCFMYNNVVAATDAVTCVVEYSMNAKPVQLSKEQIDDGYCDCVWTGNDEPTTNACSGFASWPGTTLLQPQSQQDSRYVCFLFVVMFSLWHSIYMYIHRSLS